MPGLLMSMTTMAMPARRSSTSDNFVLRHTTIMCSDESAAEMKTFWPLSR